MGVSPWMMIGAPGRVSPEGTTGDLEEPAATGMFPRELAVGGSALLTRICFVARHFAPVSRRAGA
jgi:hypothetical protein